MMNLDSPKNYWLAACPTCVQACVPARVCGPPVRMSDYTFYCKTCERTTPSGRFCFTRYKDRDHTLELLDKHTKSSR